jgi:cation/acetate symporter
VALTILSPTIWVKVLGHAAPIYPYEYPALFSMLVAFAGIYLFSVTDKSQRAGIEQRAYADQLVVSELGVKAAAATRSA